MKKTVSILCAVALVLSISAGAFAMGPGQGGFNGGMPGGQMPQMNGQAPEMNGQMPPMDGQMPGMMDQARSFIDFDSLAEDGVISEDTLANIQTYMEENQPEDLPEMNGERPEMPEMNGQAPEMNGERPELPDGEEAPVFTGLLEDLLEAGVITEDEYTAILASLNIATDTEDAE